MTKKWSPEGANDPQMWGEDAQGSVEPSLAQPDSATSFPGNSAPLSFPDAPATPSTVKNLALVLFSGAFGLVVVIALIGVVVNLFITPPSRSDPSASPSDPASSPIAGSPSAPSPLSVTATGSVHDIPESTAPPIEGETWDPQWFAGNHVEFTVDPEPGATSTGFANVFGKVLLRYTDFPDQETLLTAYDMTSDRPTEKWTQRLAFDRLKTPVRLWKNWFVIGSTLISVDTGEMTTASWDNADKVFAATFFGGEDLITCTPNNLCSYWDSPTTARWTITLDSDSTTFIDTKKTARFPEGHFLPLKSSKSYVMLDLATGSVKTPVEDSEFSHINAARDGWVMSGDHSGIAFLTPDGTLITTLAGKALSEHPTQVPWKQGGMTLHEIGLWVDEGNTDWADSTISMVQDDKCHTLSINNGAPITIGSGTIFLSGPAPDGTCVLNNGLSLAISSTSRISSYGINPMTVIDLMNGHFVKVPGHGTHGESLSMTAFGFADQGGTITVVVAGTN